MESFGAEKRRKGKKSEVDFVKIPELRFP